ncbi:MAG: hypothetical protein OXE99_09905 [Cellvibrionales bacterium]|nr:hypothetical protein [Cellvibrionales bacterium]
MSNSSHIFQPGDKPTDVSEDMIHSDDLSKKFKIKVVDQDKKDVGYIRFNADSTYNHYAKIESSGDEFQILKVDRQELWKVVSGVSAGYWLSATPNAWLVTSELRWALSFYEQNGSIWEDKTGRPLSCKGAPALGKDIAVWNAGGYLALQVVLEPVE